MSKESRNGPEPEVPQVEMEDSTPEAPTGGPEAVSAPPQDPVQVELAAARQRIDELARALSAAINDQKDFRARIEREKARVLEVERSKVAIELIEMGDELDRALEAALEIDDPMARGVRMIREGLARRLAGMGIEQLRLVGKVFDPQVAEAVDLVPVTETERDGVVIEEVRPGYRSKEKLVREARVRVGKYVDRRQV